MHRTFKKRVAAAATGLLVAAGVTVGFGTSALAENTATTNDAPATAAATPHQWLTGYWHNFDNGSTILKLSDVPSAYNLVAVAFADNHPSLSGGITFNLESEELNGYSEAEFKADIAAIQAEGRKVIISVGGEIGNVIVNSSAAAQNFSDTTYALMQEYGFDGVDIDLEHGINAQYMSEALHSLSAKVGPELIITMAPQTIDYQYNTAPYYQLTENISDILTIVNMQYYNSGSMMGCDQQVYSQGTPDFLAALACIQLEMDLRPDQVGLGVPAVPKAAGGGYQSMANVVKAVDCLETGTNCGSFSPETPYGPIGGVMTWSVNWDATNGYELARVMSERLNVDGEWTAPDPGDGNDNDGSGDDGSADDGSGDDGSGDDGSADDGSADDGSGDDGSSDDGTGEDGNEPGTCDGDAPAWNSGGVYQGGDEVSHNGHNWRAKWWTQGDEPGEGGEWGVWQDLGECDDATDPGNDQDGSSDDGAGEDGSGDDGSADDGSGDDGAADDGNNDDGNTNPAECPAAWVSSAVYVKGDSVTYNGNVYDAKWWTTGETPGSSTWGAWELVESCS